MTNISRRSLWVAWIVLALPLAAYMGHLAWQEHSWSTGFLQAQVDKFEAMGREESTEIQTILYERGPARLQRESNRKRNVSVVISALLISLPLTLPYVMVAWNRAILRKPVASVTGASPRITSASSAILKRRVVIVVTLVGLGAACYWYIVVYRPTHQAMERVTRSLIDPESARFRDVRMINGVVCGDVNAKNRMGGYTGFSKFVFINGRIGMQVADPKDSDDREINERIENLCQ